MTDIKNEGAFEISKKAKVYLKHRNETVSAQQRFVP